MQSPPQPARLASPPVGGLSAGPQPRQTRRPYTTSELKFVQQHYPESTAAILAQQLDRTPGLLRDLIHRFQLQKQGRP